MVGRAPFDVPVLVSGVALVGEVIDVDDRAVGELERRRAVDYLVDAGAQVSIPPLVSTVVAGPDPVVVAGDQHDATEKATQMVDRAIEATHAGVAEEPHLVVGADDLIPPIDQETVEARLSLVVGWPVERRHSSRLGATGLILGDVAVTEV